MIQLTREEVQQVLKFVHRVTHWEEGRPDRNDTLKLLQSKLAEQCFCDRNNLGKPGVSCGDCPTRDYKTEKDDVEPVTAQAAAIRTLTFLGYTYHGAEQWKPPLGKTPEPVSDFDIRGKLSALKCWHRLSGDEIQDLIEFFGGSSAAPKPMTEPICGKNYAAGLWSRRNLEAYLEDQGC
jgi:hypothetical protein